MCIQKYGDMHPVMIDRRCRDEVGGRGGGGSKHMQISGLVSTLQFSLSDCTS